VLRVVERELHEPLERHRAAGHLFADEIDEPGIPQCREAGVEVKGHVSSFTDRLTVGDRWVHSGP
jgi:hypothetical protein